MPGLYRHSVQSVYAWIKLRQAGTFQKWGKNGFMERDFEGFPGYPAVAAKRRKGIKTNAIA
jgi:hypothetical protein